MSFDDMTVLERVCLDLQSLMVRVFIDGLMEMRWLHSFFVVPYQSLYGYKHI